MLGRVYEQVKEPLIQWHDWVDVVRRDITPILKCIG